MQTSRGTKMRCALLLWAHFSLVLVLIADSADFTTSRPCPTHCGRLLIQFPFGIGEGCYLDKWFEIQCNNSTSGEVVPYLPKISKEVVSIELPNRSFSQGMSFPYGLLRIKTNITSSGCSNNNNNGSNFGEPLNFTDSPFIIGRSNKLVAVGCNNKATLTNLEPRLVGCIASCGPSEEGDPSSCNGFKCCQADTPVQVGKVIGVSIEDTNSNTTREGECKAFLTDEFDKSPKMAKPTDPQWLHDRKYVTVQLEWVIPSSNYSFISFVGCRYQERFAWNHRSDLPCSCGTDPFNGWGCVCEDGYNGNPYLLDGCKDIDECQQLKSDGSSKYCNKADTCVNIQGSYHCIINKSKTLPIAIGFSVAIGVLIFIGVSVWLYKFIKRRRIINQKKKFFKRNGGLLLQQQLTSTEGSVEKTIVFNSKELEKATENFSLNRVLGQGGQGTVYKGMLIDGRIVAVKKSKVVDQDKLQEFINEVVILSQLNHRNIVRLLGCCLETEVPLLVYEFIPNGNLFEHLHDNESDDYTMATWEMRLRIALDIAGAISYLHSAAASPVYHRDIKTTNIMLDEKYQAKVSDFGTSRSVTVDHTHLTTLVSGTAGYVDPEYFQSSRFTDKSDVYSFGVVLVELITGEKPVSLLRSAENRTLATYFIFAMEDNRLVDIIDPRIKDNCKLEQVMAAAQLARSCLNLNGKNRPSMRQVSMELERIRSPTGDFVKNEVHEVNPVEVNIGVEFCNNVAVTAPLVFQDNHATTSWLDAEPLFPRQTW